MLESGEYATLAELADAESIRRSYVYRVLRLTLLAPDIVERILDGGLAQFFKPPFPVEWERQLQRSYEQGAATRDPSGNREHAEFESNARGLRLSALSKSCASRSGGIAQWRWVHGRPWCRSFDLRGERDD
jgi:hypothetical protein